MWHLSRNWEEVLKLSSQGWSTVDNWSWSIEQKNEQRDTKEWKAALWVEHTAHRVTAGRKGDKPHRADAPSKDTLPDDSTPDFFSRSWWGHPREKLAWTPERCQNDSNDGRYSMNYSDENEEDQRRIPETYRLLVQQSRHRVRTEQKRPYFWFGNGQMWARGKILSLTFIYWV